MALSAVFTVCGVITAGATTLYAGVDHAEYLQPIEEEHGDAMNQRLQGQAGQPQYNPAAQQAMHQPQFDNPMAGHADAYHSVPRLAGNVDLATHVGPTVEWFPIPKWMAGQWQKDGDLTVSYRDLRTNRFTSMSAWTENKMSSFWGHQTDREGNVWHADILPIERDGWSKGKLARFMMVALKCEHSSPKQIVTRARYMVTETYNGSGPIIDMFQQESLNDYTLLPDGEMENISSNRIYSAQGLPLREGGLVSRLRRMGPFTPVPTQSNIDLRKSLNDYLRLHGMANLATD